MSERAMSENVSGVELKRAPVSTLGGTPIAMRIHPHRRQRTLRLGKIAVQLRGATGRLLGRFCPCRSLEISVDTLSDPGISQRRKRERDPGIPRSGLFEERNRGFAISRRGLREVIAAH